MPVEKVRPFFVVRKLMRNLGFVAMVFALVGVTVIGQDRPGDDFGRADWCTGWSGPARRETPHCEVRVETLRAGGALAVDAGTNGAISVRGWDREDVHVRVRVTGGARTEAEARDIVSRVRIITASDRIHAEGPPNERDAAWSADFEIQVPHRTQLMLKAHNGALELSDFSGTAELLTNKGGVQIADAGGDIRARTEKGGITISLSGPRWDGRGLDVQTTNGGIRLDVPRDYSAELETATVDGDFRIDFPATVHGHLGRSIRATLGSGGALIRAVTTKGGVVVRRR
jgi:hypothetical protein